jgi:lipoprotein-anchoring transpeptidase ErfK/SrfK
LLGKRSSEQPIDFVTLLFLAGVRSLGSRIIDLNFCLIADPSRRTVVQTIKTSSIVVLLMTVMYGGYVSLTTPPEPIPPEVADLLQFEDDLGIDTGFAVTTGQSDQPAGEPSARIAEGVDFPPIATPAPPTVPATLSLGTPQGEVPRAPAPQPFQAENGTQNGLTAPGQPASLPGLPPISTPAKAVSLDMNTNFPATQGSFQLPTPENAQNNFNPQQGRSFNAPQINAPGVEAGGVSGGGMSMPSRDNLQSADQPRTELTEQVSVNLDPKAAIGQVSLADQTATANIGLTNAFKTADRQYNNDQMREALATLSVFYGIPNLPVAQRGQLLTRLDPLAREVIYSTRHLMEKPHRVGTNETLMEIAEKYRVPWQLLANINGIKDPLVITPGTELKVVPGPFNAQVDLAKRELTIFLGDLYAGRFPIAVGSDPAPKPGNFTVQDKQSQRTFYDRSGSPVPAGAPGNPYGNAWIDLGNKICIHGSPQPDSPTTNGCISLAGDFADDLFGILSQGSSVTIR